MSIHQPDSVPLQRVLVANRGEIAMRIVHAARELGISTVGVYSEADERLPHLAECDEAVCIGPPPAAQSYLNIERLLAVAAERDCDCLHPGYGFLAENADFARRVVGAGLTWIGPHPDAIEAMGDKIDAKRRMAEHGVPTVPGFTADLSRGTWNLEQAREVGYPLLVKPTAGGGGKGMYVVRQEADLLDALARSEHDAAQSFGRGGLLVERFLDQPRHIEVQVLGDKHGTVVHLFERECSIQRRHQKLIEEAPSPAVDDELRQRICAMGVTAARVCEYDSAGTVECLVDGATGEYFFLEMNTRLQVEHPVTEAITGVDLAKAMFRVAADEPLWFRQEDVTMRGHAIECRIIAEDPYATFMPNFGMLTAFHRPSGPGVRVDAGFAAGVEVSQYYDSLLAKLVTWGNDRREATQRMLCALAEFHVAGVQTCIPFHKAMLQDEAFVSGAFDVHTCERLMTDGLLSKSSAHVDEVVALSLALQELGMKPGQTARAPGAPAGASASATTDSTATAAGEGNGRREPIDLWRYSKRPVRLRDVRD